MTDAQIAKKAVMPCANMDDPDQPANPLRNHAYSNI